MLSYPCLLWPDPRLLRKSTNLVLAEHKPQTIARFCCAALGVMKTLHISQVSGPLLNFPYRIILMIGGELVDKGPLNNAGDGELLLVVNPEIISMSGDDARSRGDTCPCLPSFEITVKRPYSIHLEYQTFQPGVSETDFQTGNLDELITVERIFKGEMAYRLHHELDHLNGVGLEWQLSTLRRDSLRKPAELNRRVNEKFFRDWTTLDDLITGVDGLDADLKRYHQVRDALVLTAPTKNKLDVLLKGITTSARGSLELHVPSHEFDPLITAIDGSGNLMSAALIHHIHNVEGLTRAENYLRKIEKIWEKLSAIKAAKAKRGEAIHEKEEDETE